MSLQETIGANNELKVAYIDTYNSGSPIYCN